MRLHRPKTCSDVVLRARLFRRLDTNLDNPLTLISVPAGYGKTTLVTSWLDDVAARAANGTPAPFRTAWLSLDAQANTLPLFFAALAAAVDGAFPGACAGIEDLLAAEQQPVPSVLVSALCAACARLPDKLVLVLDDYYLITNESVHVAMADLLQGWGPYVHVIVVTRAIPPLRLSQLRARRQLDELLARDLQFDVSEVAQFMHRSMAEEVPAALIDMLHERTEGWAAGVRLAVLAMQQRGDVDATIQDFDRNSNRYIMDFLAEEVLRGLPPDFQSFLLRTAVLPRMCSALCAAVVEDLDAPSCQSMLDEMERRNLFIVNLDDHRGWYRYHHQFQTLLVNHLHQSVAQAEIIALRRRAAAWLGENGYPDEAILEHTALGDHDAAAQVIEDNLVDLQNDEQWPRLMRWLAHMPADVVDRRPGLLIARGWTRRIQFADDAIGQLLARAEGLLENADGAERARWWPQLLSLRSWSTLIPDVDERIVAAREACRTASPKHVWVRAFAQMNAVLAQQVKGDFDSALRTLDDAIDDVEYGTGKSLARLHLTGAVAHYFEGVFSGTLWHAKQCHALATEHHMPMTAVWGQYLQGAVHYFRNDLSAAEGHHRTVLDLALLANRQAAALSAHQLINILAERGDLDTAASVLRHWRKIEVESGQPDARIANALAAGLDLLRGDLESAYAWAQAVELAGKRARLNDPEWITLVRVLVAQGIPASLTKAHAVLDHIQEHCARMCDRRSYHEALVWRAHAHHAQGRASQAVQVLAEAVAFAEPRGCVRWFVEGGDRMRDLLARLARGVPSATHAAALLAQAWPARTPPRAPKPAVDALPDALTPREVEVLELIADKLTNKEIASRLGISPLTVRNHTSNIYDKLQVARRGQAVRRAKAEGLIP